jgi:hypothetical protein
MNRILVLFATSILSVAANAKTAAKEPVKAKAIETICQENADIALTKVAAALGLGKGVGHLGGSAPSEEAEKDGSGNTILTFGGAPLAGPKDDGYISGAGAIVRMVITGKSTCEVENVNIDTGASFRHELSQPQK